MKDQEYKNIDDYLLGRLEGEALIEFEKELNVNMDLKKKVAEQKQAIDLIEKVNDLKIKQEIFEAQETYKSEEKPKTLVKSLRPYFMVAAGMLFLFFAFWFFENRTSDQFIRSSYTVYDISFGTRSNMSPESMQLAEASQFYKNGNYEEALKRFESLAAVQDARILLAMGICHIELQQYEKALDSFEQIVLDKDPTFKYHGIWYSAMTYLKTNDIEKSKVELRKLVDAKDDGEVYKQKEAKFLLKEL